MPDFKSGNSSLELYKVIFNLIVIIYSNITKPIP